MWISNISASCLKSMKTWNNNETRYTVCHSFWTLEIIQSIVICYLWSLDFLNRASVIQGPAVQTRVITEPCVRSARRIGGTLLLDMSAGVHLDLKVFTVNTVRNLFYFTEILLIMKYIWSHTINRWLWSWQEEEGGVLVKTQKPLALGLFVCCDLLCMWMLYLVWV